MLFPAALTTDRQTLERTGRAGVAAVPVGNGAILCRVLDRYKAYVDADDLLIAPHLALEGYWESWVTLAVARTLRPGSFAVDVGANLGYYTLQLADAARDGGAALAVEPAPRMTALLERTLIVNGFTHVQLERRAASDVSNRTVALVLEDGYANATIARAPSPGERTVDVETVTIDDATGDWPRVDFVKIDAEGAEEAIWEGMGRTIERNPDLTIVLEVNPLRYADPSAFNARIEDAGFPLQYIDYDGRVVPTTAAEVVSPRGPLDWMLYLTRTGPSRRS